MDSEREKSEQRIELNRQHLKEWNANLALEIEVRFALIKKHEQENIRLYLEEINFHERATLAIRQARELDELKHQDREGRIVTQKRQAQEKVALDQKLSY
ncbi:hypothetical protein GCM10028808_59780 [Spirosoma migulaei]